MTYGPASFRAGYGGKPEKTVKPDKQAKPGKSRERQGIDLLKKVMKTGSTAQQDPQVMPEELTVTTVREYAIARWKQKGKNQNKE